MNTSTVTGSENIIIQDVNNSTITLNINGQVKEVQNQLSELKELLKNLKVQNIQYAEKIYNIDQINEANFGVVTSPKVFNGVLTKELILRLKDKKRVESFLSSLPPEDKDGWDSVRQHLKKAQGILEDSFVWVIGWELRRLFSIGNDKNKVLEIKIAEYINHCFSTYRITLELANYIFISKLWDEKANNNKINSDLPPIRDFFNSNRSLKLTELRILFQTLLEIFQKEKLEYPLDPSDIDGFDQFILPDSKFNTACAEIEKLDAIDDTSEVYGLGHCHTAEISLTTILSQFKFFTNYQLVTLKKIEYEESRNSPARYIKDLNVLEKHEAAELKRLLKYDNMPAKTYSVFFRNKNRSVNLFPFLLDYNALTNEEDFQILFHQCLEGESGLSYYSIKTEKEEIIHYMANTAERIEIKSEEQKEEMQRNLRLDLVPKQFEEAMNTILGTSFSFKPKGNTKDKMENI